MDQYIEFASNHPILVTAFVIVLLMFLWSLFSSLLYGKFMLSTDKVVYHINHSKAQLLDIRGKEEYDNGHIENAMHAGLDGDADIASKVKPDKEGYIILYGDPTLALRCLRTLNMGGYKNVFCLKGGIHTWKEAGLPLSKNGK